MRFLLPLLLLCLANTTPAFAKTSLRRSEDVEEPIDDFEEEAEEIDQDHRKLFTWSDYCSSDEYKLKDERCGAGGSLDCCPYIRKNVKHKYNGMWGPKGEWYHHRLTCRKEYDDQGFIKEHTHNRCRETKFYDEWDGFDGTVDFDKYYQCVQCGCSHWKCYNEYSSYSRELELNSEGTNCIGPACGIALVDALQGDKCAEYDPSTCYCPTTFPECREERWERKNEWIDIEWCSMEPPSESSWRAKIRERNSDVCNEHYSAYCWCDKYGDERCQGYSPICVFYNGD